MITSLARRGGSVGGGGGGGNSFSDYNDGEWTTAEIIGVCIAAFTALFLIALLVLYCAVRLVIVYRKYITFRSE